MRDPEPIVLGVDASRYLDARHGMKRYLKAFLPDLVKRPGVATVLVAEGELFERLRRRFANVPVDVAEPGDVRRDALDVAWHPWGAIGFASDAPALLTLHDAGPFAKGLAERWRELGPAWRERRGFERHVRRAEHVLALSGWSKARLSAAIDVDPAAITAAPPLPGETWSPGPQEMPHADLGDLPFVLCVAGWKGHHALERALELFEGPLREVELELVVVCGALDAAVAARLAALPRARHLTEAFDDAAMRGLYRNAALVLHPAPKSHWSQVCAEAVACGAAVVAAEGGSVPEIAGGAALTLSADDPAAWLEAVPELLADEAALDARRAAARAARAPLVGGASTARLLAVVGALAADEDVARAVARAEAA